MLLSERDISQIYNTVLCLPGFHMLLRCSGGGFIGISCIFSLYVTCVKLKARGPNQARGGFNFGPQDHFKLLLDLARRYLENRSDAS